MLALQNVKIEMAEYSNTTNIYEMMKHFGRGVIMIMAVVLKIAIFL